MRQIHRVLGILMLAPLLLWALTGLIFLIKPGYDSAYHRPSLKFYPLSGQVEVSGSDEWAELRIVKTILGDHLLVLENNEWRHLDPFTLQTKGRPNNDEIKLLVADAIKHQEGRYGSIVAVEHSTIQTDTGVVLTLDWDTLSLSQKGSDTRIIDALYRAHYLQWSPSPIFNRVLGALGIALLFALSMAGLWLIASARNGESD